MDFNIKGRGIRSLLLERFSRLDYELLISFPVHNWKNIYMYLYVIAIVDPVIYMDIRLNPYRETTGK